MKNNYTFADGGPPPQVLVDVSHPERGDDLITVFIFGLIGSVAAIIILIMGIEAGWGAGALFWPPTLITGIILVRRSERRSKQPTPIDVKQVTDERLQRLRDEVFRCLSKNVITEEEAESLVKPIKMLFFDSFGGRYNNDYMDLRTDYFVCCISILGMKDVLRLNPHLSHDHRLILEDLQNLSYNPAKWMIHYKYREAMFLNADNELITPENAKHPGKKAEELRLKAQEKYRIDLKLQEWEEFQQREAEKEENIR